MTIVRPQSLHLGRLASASEGGALELPASNGTLRVLHLADERPDEPRACWYVCLAGRVIVDLPYANFAHLRSQEACRVEAGIPRTLTPIGSATVLVIEVGA